MREIEDILDEEAGGLQCRDEDLIHPLADALAHRNPLAWCGGVVPSHHDADLRYALISLQPASIKQLDLLIAVDSAHPRAWWMSKHTLALRMLQDTIASGPCDQRHSCLNQLSNRYHITILPIEANESHLWRESKEPQVGRDGSKCRS